MDRRRDPNLGLHLQRLRIYYESVHSSADSVHYSQALKCIPRVETGVAQFPKDLTVHPNTCAATLGNVIYQSRNPHRHFAVVEHPEILVRDLQAMMRKCKKAYGMCVLFAWVGMGNQMRGRHRRQPYRNANL